MGNHKFRLIPNAWLYKLKQMATNKSTNSKSESHGAEKAEHSTPPPPVLPHHPNFLSHPRKSYHITRDLNPKTPKSSDSSELLNTPLDPPRKSARRRRPTTNKRTKSSLTNSSSSSVSTGCSCHASAAVHSLRTKPPASSSHSPTTTSSSSVDHVSLLPEFSPNRSLPSVSFDGMVAWSSASSYLARSSNSPVTEDDNNDIVIGVTDMTLRRQTGETVSKIGLPPIKTEHKKLSYLVKENGRTQVQEEAICEPIKQRKSSVKSRNGGGNGSSVFKEDSLASSVSKEQGSSPISIRRISTGSPRRVRIRINSPRLSTRVGMNAGRSRMSLKRNNISREWESMAVVKRSSDPQRDFRESMMEMIVENNISASKELEELLACYLSLNSMEYHHVIIQVFQQIWFDLSDISNPISVRKGKRSG